MTGSSSSYNRTYSARWPLVPIRSWLSVTSGRTRFFNALARSRTSYNSQTPARYTRCSMFLSYVKLSRQRNKSKTSFRQQQRQAQFQRRSWSAGLCNAAARKCLGCWCVGPINHQSSRPGRIQKTFDNIFPGHQLGGKLCLQEEGVLRPPFPLARSPPTLGPRLLLHPLGRNGPVDKSSPTGG